MLLKSSGVLGIFGSLTILEAGGGKGGKEKRKRVEKRYGVNRKNA